MNVSWRKAYVNSAKFRTIPGKLHIRDVLFTSNIKDAAHYPSRDEAQIDVRLIFERLITIETVGGYKYRLENFKVEERAPNEFVISVEGPFAIRANEPRLPSQE